MEIIVLKRQVLGLAWRLNVGWVLSLAHVHKAVDQRENCCQRLTAGQNNKKLLEKDVLIRLHMHRHKSL